MPFKQRLLVSRERKRSNIILALDVVDRTPNGQLSKAKSILQDTATHICAVKINRQLILTCGLEGVSRQLVRMCYRLRLPVIMDAKINDVGHTNAFIANAYFRAGFDAVTASPFVGWEEGLQPVFRIARKSERGVILLVYLSHRGAREMYGRIVIEGGRRRRMFEVFAQYAKKWRADGAIVGAPRPRVIERVKELLGSGVPILAPGVGSQGGDVRQAMLAGAHYLIVGRAIIEAEEPALAAERMANLARQYL